MGGGGAGREARGEEAGERRRRGRYRSLWRSSAARHAGQRGEGAVRGGERGEGACPQGQAVKRGGERGGEGRGGEGGGCPTRAGRRSRSRAVSRPAASSPTATTSSCYLVAVLSCRWASSGRTMMLCERRNSASCSQRGGVKASPRCRRAQLTPKSFWHCPASWAACALVNC